MRKPWKPIAAALLIGAALVTAVALAHIQLRAGASLRIIGSYPIPSGGQADAAIDLPGTRVALRTFDIPYNYYEFDCATLQFANPQYFDHPDIGNDKLGWVCWAGSAANLGLDFRDRQHAGIGSRVTGDLLYEFPLDGEVPLMYAGMADGTEVMVIISEFSGKTHFLNLSAPGFLGTVSWPAGYATPREWMMQIEDDYITRHGLQSYCYNTQSQTLFMAISHESLIYWCQVDLTSGFDYTTGTIGCGTMPQGIIQSTDGSAVYVFDDAANQVFTINPFAKQVTNTAQFESGSHLGKMIYHQGHLYFALSVAPASQHVQRLVRLDPASGTSVAVTLAGRAIMDLDAYGSNIYALQHIGQDNCNLRELRATDLELLGDIVVGSNEIIRMMVDQPSGRLVVDDRENNSIIVVQL